MKGTAASALPHFAAEVRGISPRRFRTNRSNESASRPGKTFFEFLRQLVRRYRGRKVFLIIDNAPCHRLDESGVCWLRENRHLIELHRLPAYSPEFIPMEGVWKTTRKLTTHNTSLVTPDQRDAKLTATFNAFQRRPALIAARREVPMIARAQS